MNNLQIFKNDRFGEVRTIVENNNTWFCGADVARALGYSNTRDALLRHCKEKGVAFHDILTNSGSQKAKFINEANLYRLVANSQLPEAENFEAWIFEEVLPSIRKTGSYQVPQEFNLDYARQCLESWEKAEKALTVANKTINKLAPLADFAQNVLSDHGSASMQLGQFAKCVNCGMGQNQLFEWMRKKGFLFKIAGMNLPMQEYLNRGYFTCVEKTFSVRQNGIVNHKTSVTTLITLKGQEWLVRKLREDGYTVNKELQIHLNLNITTNGVVNVQ